MASAREMPYRRAGQVDGTPAALGCAYCVPEGDDRVIHIEIGDRFRATACCLLLTPYAEENLTYHLPHPLRVATLAAIKSHRDHPCAKLFREHAAAGNFGGQFYSLGAWLTTCHPFSWTASPAEITSQGGIWPEALERLAADGSYPALLTSFLEDAKLPRVWRSLQREWTRVAEQCRAALIRYDVEGWMLSFWGPPTKRLVLVPNPTDPPTFGFGPSNRTEALCIVGPPAVPKETPDGETEALFDYAHGDGVADLVVHEFGHSYLAQAREAISHVAEQTAEVGRSLQLKDWFPKMYGEWPMQLEEIILRAAQATWRAEKVSRRSADEYVQNESDRFGLAVLPPMYHLLLEQRINGVSPMPEGVARTARQALERFRTRTLPR